MFEENQPFAISDSLVLVDDGGISLCPDTSPALHELAMGFALQHHVILQEDLLSLSLSLPEMLLLGCCQNGEYLCRVPTNRYWFLSLNSQLSSQSTSITWIFPFLCTYTL